jgi:serine/threonine protein kinase
MVTPQENRFASLAMEQGELSADELGACLNLKGEKEEQGSRIPLWECAVLEGIMPADVAEELAEAAGDLDAEKLDDFKITKKLGEGGMGSVYLGVDPDRQRAAIKVLAPDLAKQRALRTRFYREAEASCELQHENVVQGLSVGEDAGYYYFAMEYVDGTNVHEMLRTRGRLPARETANLIVQVARGLAHAHEHGIIHRDIKPGNILVTREGVAKLADLGLVRQLDNDQTALTRTGTSLGTPWYVAPEQANDAKSADERSDLYALGATWYHMVAGRPPFEGKGVLEILQGHLKEPVKPVESYAPGTPRGISVVISNLLAKKPEQRIQSAAELAEIIEKKCLGARNIKDELGISEEERPEGEDELWDAHVRVGDRTEKRRLSRSEMRTRIDRGQVSFETPVRHAGSDEPYRPASSFFTLEKEFPARTPAPDMESPPSTTRMELHKLLTQFDEEDEEYHRRRSLRKLVPYAVELGILLGVAVVLWFFRGPIWAAVQSLVGGGGS